MAKFVFLKHKNYQDVEFSRGVVYHISNDLENKNNMDSVLRFNIEKNGIHFDSGRWLEVDDATSVSIGDAFDGRNFISESIYAEQRRTGAINW